MGRVSNKVVKRAARQIVEKHYQRLTYDFYHNKAITFDIAVISSKKLRNKVAGYVTRLMKRIRYSKVKGVSIKLQEEERERKESFVPTESILDVDRIDVDSVTMKMIKEMMLPGSFYVPSTEGKIN